MNSTREYSLPNDSVGLTLRVGSFLENSNTEVVVFQAPTKTAAPFVKKRTTLRVGSFSWKRVILELWLSTGKGSSDF